jgi:hypothetical protein
LLLRFSLSTNGRRMMQEGAERAPAECVIFARVENKLVPQVVGDLRRHRDETIAAHQIGDEELARPARNQRAVLALEAGAMFLEPVEQARRPAIGSDEFGAPQMEPLAEQGDRDHSRDERQRDRYA